MSGSADQTDRVNHHSKRCCRCRGSCCFCARCLCVPPLIESSKILLISSTGLCILPCVFLQEARPILLWGVDCELCLSCGVLVVLAPGDLLARLNTDLVEGCVRGLSLRALLRGDICNGGAFVISAWGFWLR